MLKHLLAHGSHVGRDHRQRRHLRCIRLWSHRRSGGRRRWGARQLRVPHGAIRSRSGDLASLITADWTQDGHAALLQEFVPICVVGTSWLLRIGVATQGGPGLGPGMPEDRDPVTAAATPEVSSHLPPWRHAKRETLGDRATLSIEASALAAC